MVDSAKATASDPDKLDIMLAFTNDDTTLVDYSDRMDGKILYTEIWPDYPTAYKWNKLASIAFKHQRNRLFMLAADDMVFATPDWDAALIDHYNALENKIHVYHLRDSRHEEGTPHPIVTRAYMEAMGYFLPPIFLHWYVDSWTVDIAKANYCFTHLKDYELIHDKLNDRGQPDETHMRIRRAGWHERDKWLAEQCRGYLEYEKARLALHINAQRVV